MTEDRMSFGQQDFVGVWMLTIYAESSDMQAPANPFGDKSMGVLIYTADGYISAQLMRPDRKNSAVGTQDYLLT